jgi:hypothetical protein
MLMGQIADALVPMSGGYLAVTIFLLVQSMGLL